MSKRSLVMLADDYNPLKFKAEGSFMSEKLDGVRALWLPFTRGMEFKDVPWANRARDDRNYICSGLWTRRGKPVLAPDWWLDLLPLVMPADGELFIGRKRFNDTTSTIRKLEPIDQEWQEVKYKVFDVPSYQQFFKDGWIREGGKAGDPAYEVFMKSAWLDLFKLRDSRFYPQIRFTDVLRCLNDYNEVFQPIQFEQLAFTRAEAEEMVAEKLREVTDAGGEGIMLRRPHTVWEPLRHHELVKVKKLHDSEAQIIGYVFGEGKYQGMVGAFRVRWNPTVSKGPVIFDLSGFTDAERQVKFEFQKMASEHPGEKCDLSVSEHFPIGSAVTFSYNEVTPDGKPRFARYLRKYNVD